MLRLALLVAVGVTAGVRAQEACGDQVAKAMMCGAEGLLTRLADMPWFKMDHEAIETAIMQCFPDNGCVDPREMEAMLEELGVSSGSKSGSSEYGGGEMLQRLSDAAEFLGIDPDEMKKVVETGMKCAEEMKPKVMPAIQQCVQGFDPSLAGFTFPPKINVPALLQNEIGANDALEMASTPIPMQIFGLLHEMKKGHKEMEHEIMEMVMAMHHKAVCDTKEKSLAVRACVDKVIDDATPEEMKCPSPLDPIYQMVDAKDDFCAKRDECMADVSETCATAFKLVPQAMCHCGKQYMDSNWTMITNEITTCLNDNMEKPVQLSEIMVNGPLKSVAKDIMDAECGEMLMMVGNPQMDPCSDDFDPRVLHKGEAKGKGHGKGMHKGGPPKGMPFKGDMSGGPPKGLPIGPPMPPMAQ